MAPRAYWKGHLKLSLVSCAVALFPATTRSDRIHFNILNRRTGHRVQYDVVDAETGEDVPREDRVKGYPVEEGDFVLVEDEDFDRVALQSTHTIEIDSFIAREDVDPLYLDESYYLVPDDSVGVEAFAVIRDAMNRKALAGVARVVLHRREQLLMLEPRGRGIMATGLRYRTEVRSEEAYFAEIPEVRLPSDMRTLADHILDSKTATFDPAGFEDRYEAALAALIRAKQAGKPPPSPPGPEGGKVISLMDALRRSAKAGHAPPRQAARGAAAKPAKAGGPRSKAKTGSRRSTSRKGRAGTIRKAG